MFLQRCLCKSVQRLCHLQHGTAGPCIVLSDNSRGNKYRFQNLTSCARLASSRESAPTDLSRGGVVPTDDTKQRTKVGGRDKNWNVNPKYNKFGANKQTKESTFNPRWKRSSNLFRQLAADVVLGDRADSEDYRRRVDITKDNDDDDVNEYSGAYLHTHKRGFLAHSTEYNRSCVVNVLETRRTFYNPQIDDINIETLVNCLVDNQEVSTDVLSLGLKSLTQLPAEKLCKYENMRRLPLLMVKYLSHIAHKCDSDIFCDALLTMVCLHCVPSKNETGKLHKQCLKHLKSWDLHTMMLVSDCWIYLDQSRLSYHQEMTDIASNDLYYGTDLSAQNVVQLLFILSLGKTSPSPGVITKLLNIVRNSIRDMTWEEIGIICFALVKIRTPRDERSISFLTALSKKFIHGLQANDVDLYTMTQVMRCLSRCYFYDVPTFDALEASLTPVIRDNPNLYELRVSHIAMAFAKVRMFYKPLMDTITHHVDTNQQVYRTKDAHLLLQAFGRLNYKPQHSEKFFQYLVSFLNTSHFQARTFPETFLGSLVALSFLDYYPTVLFEQAFSPEYLEQCDKIIAKRGTFPICKHLFVLDCSLAIECPDYHGNRIPQHYINMYKDVHHGSTYHTQQMEEKGVSADVISLLRRLFGGTDYVKVHAILPHIKTPADIEIHLDSDGNAVIPSSFPTDDSLGPNLTNVAIPYYKLSELVTETKDQLNTGANRVAVLVTTPKHYHSNSHGLLGVHVMKKRQLKKVGYKILEIPYFEWDQLSQENESDKINYLKDKLQNALSDKTLT